MPKFFTSTVMYETTGFTFEDVLKSENDDLSLDGANQIMWQHYTDLGVDPNTIKSIVTVETPANEVPQGAQVIEPLPVETEPPTATTNARTIHVDMPRDADVPIWPNYIG
jgi:hypothetical protein